MKRVCAGLLTAVFLTGALSASASAADPVIYQTARAIPTKSGEFVRISVYGKHVRKVSIKVNDLPRRKATRFGTGCGSKHCSKWRIYTPRTPDNECYELEISGSRGSTGVALSHTVCEPFPGGSV